MRRKVIGAVIITIGLLIALSPFIITKLQSENFSKTISEYEQVINNTDNDELAEDLEEAKRYNEDISSGLNSDDKGNYYDLLYYGAQGEMGYISIPEQNINLPIYHGTSDEVLAKGIGHMEETSLPIGGESTHCVLVGHTGLSYAMFDNIQDMKNGDKFYITVQNTARTYEVISVKKVAATDTELINVVQGKDLVSLVTCVQGLGNERLVVTGQALTEELSTEAGIENITTDDNKPDLKENISTDQASIHQLILIIGIALVFAAGIFIFTVRYKKSRKEKNANESENSDES